MFAGHLAPGLVLLGLEQVHIPSNFVQTHYMTFTFPYAHGLVASLAWSAIGFGITYAVLPRWTTKERKQAGLAIALAVFSHFVLDWLTHIPELPLLGDDSLKTGLGLWNDLPFALTLEVALVAIGFVFYLIMVKPKTNLARYGVGGLLLFTSAMTVL